MRLTELLNYAGNQTVCVRVITKKFRVQSFAEDSVSDDIERSEKFYRIYVYAFIPFKRTKQLDVVEIPIRL